MSDKFVEIPVHCGPPSVNKYIIIAVAVVLFLVICVIIYVVITKRNKDKVNEINEDEIQKFKSLNDTGESSVVAPPPRRVKLEPSPVDSHVEQQIESPVNRSVEQPVVKSDDQSEPDQDTDDKTIENLISEINE